MGDTESMEVLTNIPVDLTPEKIFKRLRMKQQNPAITETVEELIREVRPLVNAKAVYKVSYIDRKEKDTLSIDDVMFTSRVLRVNLDKVGRVFPFIATCGSEVDQVTVTDGDTFSAFLLDAVKELVVREAGIYLRRYLKDKYALGQTAMMAPGSLADFPITQQKELFSLFGNVEELIGVRLTPSFLMTPIKSTSGIIFSTEVRFESCQLCPRENCIGRRAPFEPGLMQKYEEKALGTVG